MARWKRNTTPTEPPRHFTVTVNGRMRYIPEWIEPDLYDTLVRIADYHSDMPTYYTMQGINSFKLWPTPHPGTQIQISYV